MSTFLPNTTVSIYRTLSTADEYGEFSDDNTTLAASGVPAAIQEGYRAGQSPGRQTTFRPVSGRSTVVEWFTVRLRPLVAIGEGDRIRDERNDLWFTAVDVIRPYTVAGYADVRVGATRISDASQPVNG